MRVKFACNTVKLLGITWRIAFYRDVGPNGRVFGVYFKPLVEARLGVRLYGVGGAFRLTNATVDAFVGVDHQHVFAFVEAIYGAHFHAIHIFTFDAIFSDDIGHFDPLF